MADYNSGLKRLLEAEQRANKIIQEAEEKRSQTISQARVAAEKDLADLRDQKEAEYKAHHIDTTTEKKELEDRTRREIEKIYRDYEDNKEKVIELLIERIMKVDIQVPRNLKRRE